MPRKPSSVFVIVQPSMSNGQATAYREPLDENNTVESILERHYQNHPVGSVVFVVEDTKVTGYTIGLELVELDDPRLDEEGGLDG